MWKYVGSKTDHALKKDYFYNISDRVIWLDKRHLMSADIQYNSTPSRVILLKHIAPSQKIISGRFFGCDVSLSNLITPYLTCALRVHISTTNPFLAAVPLWWACSRFSRVTVCPAGGPDGLLVSSALVQNSVIGSIRRKETTHTHTEIPTRVTDKVTAKGMHLQAP